MNGQWLEIILKLNNNLTFELNKSMCAKIERKKEVGKEG